MDITEFLKNRKDENGKTFGEAAKGWVQDFIDGNYDHNPPTEKTWCDDAVEKTQLKYAQAKEKIILQSKS